MGQNLDYIFSRFHVWIKRNDFGATKNNVIAGLKLGKWGAWGNPKLLGCPPQTNTCFQRGYGGHNYLPPAASPGAIQRRIRWSPIGRNLVTSIFPSAAHRIGCATLGWFWLFVGGNHGQGAGGEGGDLGLKVYVLSAGVDRLPGVCGCPLTFVF